MKIKRFNENKKTKKPDYYELSIEQLMEKLDELSIRLYNPDRDADLVQISKEYKNLQNIIIENYNTIKNDLDSKYEDEAGASY
jgi:hypothetical protein